MPTLTAPLTLKGALVELGRARDAARFQLHFLSKSSISKGMRQREEMTLALEQNGQGLERATGRALKRARELARGVQGFVVRHSPIGSSLTVSLRTLMTTQVNTCSPGDSLHRAAQVLWETNCGSVPVVDAGGTLLGMLTDRDICMASFTQSRPLSAIQVESAMSRFVHTCAPTQTILDALETMSSKQVRRVPVVSDERRLLGIVCFADIARYVQSLPSKDVGAYVPLGMAIAAISESRGEPLSSVRAAE